jgi:prevent-host-death family protein
MIMVNIHEAKAKLSEYLDAVARGERVVICNRNQPVAELSPAVMPRTSPRQIGGAPGVAIPASFFAPLPDDVLDTFSGSDAAPPRPPRVAAGRGAPTRRRQRSTRARRR